MSFENRLPLTIIINIGLFNAGSDRKAPGAFGKAVSAAAVYFAAEAIRAEQQESASEPTAVIEIQALPHNLLALEYIADNICKLLNQDCIAFTVDGTGHLLGPKAADWGGKFNPEYFLLPSWAPREHADCYYDTGRNKPV